MPAKSRQGRLLASLYKREVKHPSLVKRGWGRFSDACQFDFQTLNIIPPWKLFLL